MELRVKDVPTLHMDRQTLSEVDFDVADYDVVNDEEGGEGDEEGGESKEEKLAAIRQRMQENDYDSDEEREKERERKAAQRKERKRKGREDAEEEVEEVEEVKQDQGGPSPELLALLNQLVDVAQENTQLTEITLGGDCPAIISYELRRVIDQHMGKNTRLATDKERVKNYSAAAALAAQMEELSKELDEEAPPGTLSKDSSRKKKGGLVSMEDLTREDKDATSLDIRSYVNRRLFAVLGEALFECQRYKSKENDAVAKPSGEMAFLAMYIRQAQARLEEEARAAQGQKK